MSNHIDIEFGRDTLGLDVPDATDVLRLPDVRPLDDPAGAIRAALATPLGTPAFSEIMRVWRCWWTGCTGLPCCRKLDFPC